MKYKETTFYEEIRTNTALDLRDNRGKYHNLGLVLLGLILGLLRNRDGCLSSLHRSMENTHSRLCLFLGIEDQRVISRSHLPKLLKKVNLSEFESILFRYYGIELQEEEKEWFAGDGKELRGSIKRGDKRGEAIVQLVRHSDREVLGQSFYNGKKESEQPCLQDLLKQTKACSQYITADALHLNPKTTELIEQAGGKFIIGLKGNQPEMLADMEQCTFLLKPVSQCVTEGEGKAEHGRIEKRSYKQYDISGEYLDKRWDQSNLSSLIKVERERREVKTGKYSLQTDLYISNIVPDTIDCFVPIRQHWQVEVNNHVRDVTLSEDKLRTKKSPLPSNGWT